MSKERNKSILRHLFELADRFHTDVGHGDMPNPCCIVQKGNTK